MVAGKGVCNAHLPDRSFPAVMLKPEERLTTEITKNTEGKMPKRIEIDLEKLRTLNAQGKSDLEIAKLLGCSGVTVGARRHALGLPASGRRGQRKSNSAPAIAHRAPAPRKTEIVTSP